MQGEKIDDTLLGANLRHSCPTGASHCSALMTNWGIKHLKHSTRLRKFKKQWKLRQVVFSLHWAASHWWPWWPQVGTPSPPPTFHPPTNTFLGLLLDTHYHIISYTPSPPPPSTSFHLITITTWCPPNTYYHISITPYYYITITLSPPPPTFHLLSLSYYYYF